MFRAWHWEEHFDRDLFDSGKTVEYFWHQMKRMLIKVQYIIGPKMRKLNIATATSLNMTEKSYISLKTSHVNHCKISDSY